MSAVHPSDRQIVESWAAGLRGPILDAGCGPGHWTNHLHGLGLDVQGIDLVPGFITHARATFPGIRFRVGSIDDIPEESETFAGILSWFSTIHHDPDVIATPFDEFARILRPGGRLALGFFSGPGVEPFDHAVTRAFRWPPKVLGDLLEAAGFSVVELYLRETRGERPVGTMICQHRSTEH